MPKVLHVPCRDNQSAADRARGEKIIDKLWNDPLCPHATVHPSPDLSDFGIDLDNLAGIPRLETLKPDLEICRTRRIPRPQRFNTLGYFSDNDGG